MAITAAALDEIDIADLAAFRARQEWLERARSSARKGKQIPPASVEWEILLMMAGRGWGKSEALTQFIWWECWRVPGIIGHYVAPTLGDCRGTSFEGPVGLNQIIPRECLWGGSVEKAYNTTRLQIRLANNSIIRGFGAVEEAGRLRGPQCHVLVGDELREWDRPAGNLEQAMNNALFGLRLPYPDGSPSRAVFGTTPKPISFLKRFEKRRGVRVVRGSSYENISNLATTFQTQLFALDGTQLGRQEIYGVYIDEESDLSIIKRQWIKLWPKDKPLPGFHFILEAYDTAASEENFNVKRQETDPTASIVLGIFNVAEAFNEEQRKKLGLRSRYATLLCEAWSERLGLPELLERARAQHRTKWGTPGRRADVVLIEDKSSGPGLRQFLSKFGVPAWPSNPGRRDKAMRLHAVSPLLHQGLLFVPESMRGDRAGMPRDWVEGLLEQLCAYAGKNSVEHDDYVDCITSAFTYLRDRGILEATPEQKFRDREEQHDSEERAAIKQQDEARRAKAGNPYS